MTPQRTQRTRRTPRLVLCALGVFCGFPKSQYATEISPRRVLALDGTWQIGEGNLDQVPIDFSRTIPVPGLVTLGTPAFTPPPAPVSSDRGHQRPHDPARDAFWYRRTFQLDEPVPSVARLKIHKATFGTRAVLNGRVLGERASSFTPAWFDARDALRPGENELLIRVGAHPGVVPPGVPIGFDRERVRYPPGIFDSVELILSDTPHFLRVQTVPNIADRSVRVQAMLRNERDSHAVSTEATVVIVVREAASGRIVGRATSERVTFDRGSESTVDLRVAIADGRLWSPEDPFLYRLEADCGTDRITTRFGLREFRFDPATQRAVLNGRPYFMRGSNVALYRFLEDAACRDLPWRADWVRLLHQRVKEMHWNSLRYTIGFPPEAWYDVADELGILIEDEFPIWGEAGRLKRDDLAREYAEWVQERCNHPCVVIWNARNEGNATPETGEAIKRVRDLDLSGRPWGNGWGERGPDTTGWMRPTDGFDSHSYHFSRNSGFRFTLADLAHAVPVPRRTWNAASPTHAVVLNEYGWLWLNRDGSPTTLTTEVYRHLAGEHATAAQRFHLYATHLAAETEFWRSHRQAAGVLYFSMLAGSRADGQTSDNWRDVDRLIWEPEFERYVRDAFAPVGLMVDFWSDTAIAGRRGRVPVRLINDLDCDWSGGVTLRLRNADGSTPIFEMRQECRMEPLGNATAVFDVTWPAAAGDCVLDAELPGVDGEPVHSVRELAVVVADSLGLAFERVASASASRTDGAPANAVDGDPTTWWHSPASEPAWLAVDLGELRQISRVRIRWAVAYSTAFTVQSSRDGLSWTDLHAEPNGIGGVSELRVTPTDARHVRVNCTAHTTVQRAMEPGHAIRELQVFP